MLKNNVLKNKFILIAKYYYLTLITLIVVDLGLQVTLTEFDLSRVVSRFLSQFHKVTKTTPKFSQNNAR